MRILGIDYGTKRIGIAISDEAAQFAMPTSVIKNNDGALEEVCALAKLNQVTEIIMGESRDYEQKANPVMAESLKFKESLEGAGFKVILEPEFMTSVQAERFQGKTELTDASAAALILQSFLDKQQNNA